MLLNYGPMSIIRPNGPYAKIMGPDLGDVMLGHVWILDSNLRKPN